MTAQTPERLANPGPAQNEYLIHFCGRPSGRPSTNDTPEWIKNMEPEQRLDNILREEQIRGNTPFGAGRPMVCFSEAPGDHMLWLIKNRQWPPWGIVMQRQTIYDKGGGPVWYARSEEYENFSAAQLPWAVRLDTEAGNRSEWLHEREWRLPVPTENPVLPLASDDVVAVLVGDPDWQPSTREFPHRVEGFFHPTGEPTVPGDPDGHPMEVITPMMDLPQLWKTAERWPMQTR